MVYFQSIGVTIIFIAYFLSFRIGIKFTAYFKVDAIKYYYIVDSSSFCIWVYETTATVAAIVVFFKGSII